MLPWDPIGKMGPKKPLPDHVTIAEPKEEIPRGETTQIASTHIPANITALKTDVAPPVGGVIS